MFQVWAVLYQVHQGQEEGGVFTTTLHFKAILLSVLLKTRSGLKSRISKVFTKELCFSKFELYQAYQVSLDQSKEGLSYS